MKFRDIALGNRATKTIPLPLVRDPGAEATAAPMVALRVLNGEEHAEVLEKALQFAKSGGSESPEAGDPLYQFGIQVHTVLVACVDPDAPNPESPDARFFSSVDEIMSSPLIGKDVISYLYELQQAWQEHCSPRVNELTQAEYYNQVAELAKSTDPLGFVALPLGTRWSLARTMAEQLLILLTAKSSSSETSSSGTEKESDAAAASKQTTKRKGRKA